MMYLSKIDGKCGIVNDNSVIEQLFGHLDVWTFEKILSMSNYIAGHCPFTSQASVVKNVLPLNKILVYSVFQAKKLLGFWNL